MSKPIKISDMDKPWNRKQKQFNRPKAFRPERQRILIVCEGIQTEPNYFLSIKNLLPPNIVSIQIEGEGANTLSLVDKARELRDCQLKSDYSFDQVWVVFDRDSFDADAFDNAIRSAEAGGMNCAWSNEAFELWYILHFEYRNTAMSRREYKSVLNRYLQVTYQKNATDMYLRLSRENEQNAISRAKSLVKVFQDRNIPPSQSNPCTTVFKLVEVLNQYLPQKTD
jgi:hypothetical protein